VPSSRVGASGQAPSPLLFTQSPEDKFIGTLTGPTTQNLTSEYAEPLLRVGDIQTGFGVLVRFFLGFAGLIAVVYLVFNGFRYAMARGEDNQIGQAKKGITYAIVGLLLILAAYTIVATVLNFGAQPVPSVGVGVGIFFLIFIHVFSYVFFYRIFSVILAKWEHYLLLGNHILSWHVNK
jgi:hypothetical protein